MFKKISFIIMVCAIAIAMTSCSSSQTASEQFVRVDTKNATDGSAPASRSPLSSTSGTTMGAESGKSTDSIMANVSDRKVITNASFSIQTKDYDLTINTLNDKIIATNSFLQNSNTYGDKEKGNATAEFTIRVPMDNFNDFKSSISSLGNITGTSEGGSDVTADYFDTEARLTVLMAQEKRILELLAEANIEEIIKIEDRLSQIRTEIEQLTTVIKRYDDLVSYATVRISIQQTDNYINVSQKTSFWTKVSEAFSGSIKFAGDLMQNAVLSIIWLAPYLIVISIIIAICLVANRKRQNALKERMKQQADIANNQSEKKADDTTHTS